MSRFKRRKQKVNGANDSQYTGIDLSLTGTGIVTLNENFDILHEQLISTYPKTSIEKRIMTIVEGICDNKLQFINIEGLAFGARGQRMLELGGLHYHCRLELSKQNLKYQITEPGVLKKFVTGKGNAKKELMLMRVFKKWGVEFEDNNLCDAYCLARMILERKG